MDPNEAQTATNHAAEISHLAGGDSSVVMGSQAILDAVASGELSAEAALPLLRQSFTDDSLGHTRIDLDRKSRVGSHEVIFGQNKTVDQIASIAMRMVALGLEVLITRLSEDKQAALVEQLPGFVSVPDAGLMASLGKDAPPEVVSGFADLSSAGHRRAGGEDADAGKSDLDIAVVSAGTSDRSVALEALLTARFMGAKAEHFADCGVAGLHRLLEQIQTIRQAKVVIAVAGMEAALASVVAGQVASPVIAVPTSVGYGASFGGVAALLSMLNSCASGVTVVNIDNGFGAGYSAAQICRLAKVE